MIAGRRKAWADLRARWGQSALAIAALALGVWGIGSVLIANVILRADLRSNFLDTQPPHAVLISDDFAKFDLPEIKSMAGIEEAEFRDSSFLRIEIHPGDWIPVWLYGVSDFRNIRVAKIQRQTGPSPPPPGTLLMERDGRNISDLDAGKTARIRAGARLLDVPISGVVFDPAQAPATQDHFIYAYADQPTYARLTGALSDRRLIVRFKGVRSRNDVLAQVKEVERVLAARGVAVNGVYVPEFEQHPHQWQLDTLLLLQAAIGLLAFLMGVVLVSQLMASMLAREVRQIAVLKAIGATRGQLMLIYTLMLGLLGLAAGLVAIPVALETGIAFAQFVGGKLNFDIHPGNLPNAAIPFLALASLLLPVLASLRTLQRALSPPVHQGLSDYGVTPPVQSVRVLLRAPARLSGTIVLALRNVVRQRRRAVVTVLMMALGVAIFDTGFNVRQSLTDMLEEYARSNSHDVQLVLDESVEPERMLAPLRGVNGIADTELWNGGRGELQRQVVSSNNLLGIVALPRDTKLFHPRFVEGRWLRRAAVPEVVLNKQAAQLFGTPRPGDEIALAIEGHGISRARLAVKVVGLFEDLDRPKVYIDRDDFDHAANPKHLVNSVMFVSEQRDYVSVLQLKRNIEAAVSGTDLNVLYVMAHAERVRILVDHLDIVLTAILILSLPVLLVSAFGMASTTGINIQERTREIGLLRAIGATPRVILRIITMEGLAVSVVSVSLGLLIAQPLSGVAALSFGRLMLGEGASLQYAFSLQGFAIAASVTLTFGWIASRTPARAALAVSTRDALAYA